MRLAIVCIAALSVSGCAALPASVQMASLALDGISFVVSKKSVTDHVVSIAMQKDCALWRGLTEDQLCYPDDAPTVITETKIQELAEIPETPELAQEPTLVWIPGPYLNI